jgi:hypothetical protein
MRLCASKRLTPHLFMKKTIVSQLAALCAAAILGAPHAFAATTQTFGAGSAVSTVDLSANFNSIVNDTDLTNYTEGGLSITLPGFAYESFDPFAGAGNGTPFFYASGGSNGNWLTIETNTMAEMNGVEFQDGNGWYGSGGTVLYWQTLNGGNVVSSGDVEVAPGLVVGFSDPNGFDELQVSQEDGFLGSPPGYDAIAIDNLNVQTGGVQNVPESGEYMTLCLALACAGLLYYRRQAVA